MKVNVTDDKALLQILEILICQQSPAGFSLKKINFQRQTRVCVQNRLVCRVRYHLKAFRDIKLNFEIIITEKNSLESSI